LALSSFGQVIASVAFFFIAFYLYAFISKELDKMVLNHEMEEAWKEIHKKSQYEGIVIREKKDGYRMNSQSFSRNNKEENDL